MYEYGVGFTDQTSWVGKIGEISGAGLVKRLERAILEIGEMIAANRELIARSERKIADAEPRIGLAFEYAAELDCKLQERAEVEAKLVEERLRDEEERRKEAEAARTAERERQDELRAAATELSTVNTTDIASQRPAVFGVDNAEEDAT